MDAMQAQALANLGAVVSQPNDWQQRRYDAIIRCRDAGLSYEAIASALGVSRQAVYQFVKAWPEQGGKGTVSEPTIFDRGDLVWCLVSAGYWKRGIVTDVFRAPITNREVVVVGGDGFYVDDVMPDTGEGMPVPEPQSLRA